MKIVVYYLGDSILRRVISTFEKRPLYSILHVMEKRVEGQTCQQLIRRVQKSRRLQSKSEWYVDFKDETVVLMIGTNNILIRNSKIIPMHEEYIPG